MLAMVPLLVIPFLAYNVGIAGLMGDGTDPFGAQIFSMTMMSGGVWTMTAGDLLIAVALLLLFVEMTKSTRSSNASIVDHLLSTFVFVAYLVEFLLVAGAAHPVFFTLMLISLVDVLGGFTVSLRSASRDVTLNG
jgi:ABC-type antimicrobial peptide transport system permease subunit